MGIPPFFDFIKNRDFHNVAAADVPQRSPSWPFSLQPSLRLIISRQNYF